MADAIDAVGRVLEQVRLLGDAPVVVLVLALLAVSVAANAWWIAQLVRGSLVPASREKKLESDVAELKTENKRLEAEIDRCEERELAALRAGNDTAARSVLSGEGAIELAVAVARALQDGRPERRRRAPEPREGPA